MSTTTTVPSPALLAGLKKREPVAKPTKPAAQPQVQQPVALLDPSMKGKVVTPGRRTVWTTTIDDGIRKAKQVQVGQRVQAFIHGQGRGAERYVEKVERLDEGATIRITFTDGLVNTYAPAYRFLDLDAVGTEIQVRQQVADFVEVR